LSVVHFTIIFPFSDLIKLFYRKLLKKTKKITLLEKIKKILKKLKIKLKSQYIITMVGSLEEALIRLLLKLIRKDKVYDFNKIN